MTTAAVILSQAEYEALVERLAALERRLDEKAPATQRAHLTPKEVGKWLRVDSTKVYAALDSGRLKADLAPGKKRLWRIKPADAQDWYAAFIAKKADPS